MLCVSGWLAGSWRSGWEQLFLFFWLLLLCLFSDAVSFKLTVMFWWKKTKTFHRKLHTFKDCDRSKFEFTHVRNVFRGNWRKLKGVQTRLSASADRLHHCIFVLFKLTMTRSDTQDRYRSKQYSPSDPIPKPRCSTELCVNFCCKQDTITSATAEHNILEEKRRYRILFPETKEHS